MWDESANNLSLAGASTLNVAGVLTANAGIVVDSIAIDGNAIDCISGDLELDVAGDLILDADGGDFKFRDGGAGFFTISNSSLDTVLKVEQSNQDFIIKGNDGGNEITALTLDMSDFGSAIFTAAVDITGVLSAKGGAVFNQNSADVDFRVESNGNANMLFVDGGNNRVGIGTSSPTNAFSTIVSVDADFIGVFKNNEETDGRNFGLNINAGSTSADIALNVVDHDGSNTLLRVFGNGATTIGGPATFNSTIAATSATFTTADNNPQLTLISTDADASVGPVLKLYRNSASPADNDSVGRLLFTGEDDAGNEATYARIQTIATDVSNGSENAKMEFIVAIDDTFNPSLTLEDTGAATFNRGIVVNEGSFDSDFRVESNGNANMIRVDGGNNRVGIGESLPTKTLSVLGDAIIKNTTDGTYLTLHSTQANNASGPDIVLFRDSTSPADDDALSTIFYQGKNSAGSTKDYMKVRSYILDVTDGTEDFGMDIQIMTGGNAVNALDILPTEMVINNASVDRDFRVESDGNTHMLFVDGGTNVVAVGGNVTADPWTGYYPLAIGSNLMIGSTGASSTFTNFVHAGYWNGSEWRQRYTNVTQSRHEMIGAQAGSTHNFYTSANVNVDTAVTEVKNLSLYKTESVFNEASADVDFRVESDTKEHAFFVEGEGSSNRLKIGMGTGSITNPYSQNNFTDLNIDGVWGGMISFKLGGAEKGFIGQNPSGNAGMVLGSSSGQGLTLMSGGTTPRLSIAASGAAVFNEGGVDADFRVESDAKADMLFVDAGTNRVCIGSSAMSGSFSVNGAASDGFLFTLMGGNYQNLRVKTNTAVGNGQVVFEPGTVPGSGVAQQYTSFKTLTVGNGSTVHNVIVDGSLSKGSGSFKIDHPLPAKAKTHSLVHSFVESPQANNIYRGKVNLVKGSATVNIDTVSGMSEGTYVLLNTNTQCFTSNESGWTAVKGSVSGNILTITAQESCSDTISWMVVGERHDQHMLDTEWTDGNGKVIVEPLKELES